MTTISFVCSTDNLLASILEAKSVLIDAERSTFANASAASLRRSRPSKPRFRKDRRSVGFREPWLQRIQFGAKLDEARLATDSDTHDLVAGDSFLACSSEREVPVLIEAISTFGSFGEAWLVHGHTLIPPDVVAVSTAAEAQAAYQEFYSNNLVPAIGSVRIFRLRLL